MTIQQHNIISAINVNKEVTTGANQLKILSHISLDIKVAESVAIIGVSGSGKSTLFALLAGLDPVSSGEIIVAKQKLSELDEDQRAALRARYVGFIFQSFQLLPSFTALENVMLPLDLAADAKSEEKAKRLLIRVGLQQRLDHYPKQLSGGEQQRVAIARAFVTEPAILFADEPTGNLDNHTGKTVIDILFELNHERQTTLVMVTHDEKLAERCQRRLYLDGGRLTNKASTV